MPTATAPREGLGLGGEPVAEQTPAGGRDARRPPGWQVWLACFAYTLAVGMIVQLVVLPYVFPAWHAGNGFLKGLDSAVFHELAVEQSTAIDERGWTAWELRPKRQAPAGVAGAVYALTVPRPWTMLPVNAALHATAALVLLLLVELFVPPRRRAVWSVLPFLLFPSAMAWYTQLHKDGWMIAGALLVLYGWVGLARAETWRDRWGAAAAAAGWIAAGSLLAWIVRPYSVRMMQGTAVLLALVVTAALVTRGVQGRLRWRRALLGGVVAWAMVLSVGVLGDDPIKPGGRPDRKPGTAVSWQATSLLPGSLDRGLRAVAAGRREFTRAYSDGGTTIDVDVDFRSAGEIAGYVPRAAVVAFLAPFPRQWVEEGATVAGTLMRRVVGVEMLGLYLALAWLPYAAWRWRRRIELYVIGIFCVGMMLLYAVTVNNVGALHRFRYGFIMTLATLGIAGGLSAWQDVRGRVRPRAFPGLPPEPGTAGWEGSARRDRDG